MAVEGSLDLFGLPEILQTISQQNKTGILTVQGQQDIVAVSFLGGRIVAADSLAHTVEEGLAQVLVGEGLLAAATFARASAESQAAGGRLQDLLVERGYLNRQQLLTALRLQTIRQLESLLRWEEGDFKFYGGDEVSYEEGFEPIAVEDLLLRMLVELGGRSRPPSPAAAPPRPAAPPAGAASVPGSAPAPAAPATPVPPQTPAIGAAGAVGRAPAAAPIAGVAGAASAAGIAGVPGRFPPPLPFGSGSATQVRRPGGREGATADAAGGFSDLRFPEMPDLPEILPLEPAPSAAGGAPPPPAAGPVPSARRPAGTGGAAGGAAAAPGGAAEAGVAGAAGGAVRAGGLAPSPEPLPWPAAALKAPPAASGSRAAAPLVPPSPPLPPTSSTAGRLPAAPGSGPALRAVPGARPREGSAPGAGGGRGPGSAPAGEGGMAGGAGGRVSAAAAAVVLPPGMEGAPEVPPDGAPALSGKRKFRQMRVERTALPLAPRLAAAGLALGLAALLTVALWLAPASLPLPFPWQQAERGTLVRNQREALFDKIDLAAKTAFLRDGRFPDRLAQLRDAGLLGAADLQDPRGGPLLYSAREDSYSLQATEAGRPLPDTAADESIAGNFLLDPSLLQSGPATGPPIVLLD